MVVYPQKKRRPPPATDYQYIFLGPYKITIEGHDNPILPNSLTMIDTITGWFKIVKYSDKKADKISNLVDQ